MKKVYTLIFLALWSALLLEHVGAQDRFLVVTTLSTYADIAKSIGGDLVEAKSVAPPRFNPHFIEARPTDVLKLKRADLFVHSGLDLEAWRGPLVDAAARAEIRPGGSRELDLSKGVSLLDIPQGPVSRAEGDIHLFGNPHYWLSPQNGLVIAQELAQKLSELLPEKRNLIQQNLTDFQIKLKKKEASWLELVKPYAGSEIIGYHNEWVYLMKFLGLEMKQYLEPKPGIPPSPRQIEFLTSYIQDHKIKGIIQATFYPKDAGEELSKKTGAKLLLLCQSVGEISEAPDYISMLDYNISKIVEALGQ